MSRIISGALGSLRLKSAAKATRPTSDRVKESLFSQLENLGAIEDSSVLDLFAGTGALGLEAISRGAQSAVLVEKDPAAYSVLNQNVALTKNALEKQGLTKKVEVLKVSAEKYLSTLNSKFDLVFLDPPYEYETEKLLSLVTELFEHLATGSTVVIERSSREAQLPEVRGLETISYKTYGDTSILLLRKP